MKQQTFRTETALLNELKGQKVTLVYAAAMTGDPVCKIAKLTGGMIRPRPPGGNSPWQISLTLREKDKRTDIALVRDFPVDIVILLRGEHSIDFKALNLPPVKATSRMRSHCASYAVAWEMVSNWCVGLGEVLIDTTAVAIRSQRDRYGETAER